LPLGVVVTDGIDEVKKQIRYASAWFDWELTKVEGAAC
jgi:hypothetical protein